MHSSEILLKAIMDGGKHSMIVTAPDGTVTFINNAAERLYGFEASRFIGKPISLLRAEIYEQADLEREAEAISRELGRPVDLHDVFRVALQNRVVYECERVAIGRNGVRFHALVTITAMRDEADQLAGYLSISQDISERKRLEQLKSEFISTVSHELRTPLTSIRGALGLMVGGAVGELPKAAAEVAVIAHRNSERLVRIINDILDIEKIESGKLDFDIKEHDARTLIAQSLEDNKAYGEKHGVTFVVKEAPPTLKVVADSDRFLQVLANLLSNAAKFSPQGSEVHVHAVLERRVARISVRDFGAGIPAEFQSRIFEKFAQSDATGAVRREGTGLGLSIARKLVEAMGGEIAFETRAGEGTTFHFTLPLAVTEQAAVVTAWAPRASGVHGAAGLPRILHVEDNDDLRRILQDLFAGQAEWVGAATVREARELLTRESFDLVVLDIAMPDSSGLELLDSVEALSHHPVPVLILSAREPSDPELRKRVVGILLKSRVSEEHIVRTVLDLVRKPS